MDTITVNADKLFFWSDLHFGHKRAAAEWRGFGDDIEAHDQALIKTFNAKVGRNDTTILLGDISFVGAERTNDLLSQLNGTLVLVRGNHDKALKGLALAQFHSVHSLLTVKANGMTDQEARRIVCCHFPMLAWDMQHHGAWHLHGHSHGSCRYPWTDAKILDVGVDAYGRFGPLSFQEVSAIMSTRTTQTADHHRVRDQES